MPLIVACACGKKLKAPDHLAGKKIRCPACQASLTIPDAEVQEFDNLEVEDEPGDGGYGLAAAEESAIGAAGAAFTGGLGVIKFAAGSPACVAYGPGNTWALAGVEDKVHVLEMRSSKKAYKLLDHAADVTCVAVGPDNQTALSGDEEGSLVLWSLGKTEGRRSRRLKGHPDERVNCVAFAPAGDLAASGGDDGSVRLWDLQSGDRLSLEDSTWDGEVSSVTFSADGRWLLAGGAAGDVQLWDASSGNRQRRFRGADEHIDDVTFARDESFVMAVACGKRQPRVWKWDTQSGKEQRCWESPSANKGTTLHCCAAIPGGVHVITSGVLPVDPTKTVERSGFHETMLNTTGLIGAALRVARDFQDSATMKAQDTTCLQVWNVNSGHIIHTYKETIATASRIAVNPEAARAIAAMTNGTVSIWGLPL